MKSILPWSGLVLAIIGLLIFGLAISPMQIQELIQLLGTSKQEALQRLRNIENIPIERRGPGDPILIAGKKIVLPNHVYVEAYIIMADCFVGAAKCPDLPIYVLRNTSPSVKISVSERTGEIIYEKRTDEALKARDRAAFQWLVDAIEEQSRIYMQVLGLTFIMFGGSLVMLHRNLPIAEKNSSTDF